MHIQIYVYCVIVDLRSICGLGIKILERQTEIKRIEFILEKYILIKTIYNVQRTV